MQHQLETHRLVAMTHAEEAVYSVCMCACVCFCVRALNPLKLRNGVNGGTHWLPAAMTSSVLTGKRETENRGNADVCVCVCVFVSL